MMNYWWVTRPQRKLNKVPEILALLAELNLNEKWNGQLQNQLNFESALEYSGIKRIGDRRDQRAGGARTYISWLESLGLVFKHRVGNDKVIEFTLAGEAILEGKSPVKILKNQIFKYQFPSAYSTSPSINVDRRFKIRPFRFLFKLILDERISYLTEEEIGKIIIVEAENESNHCFENIIKRILEFRKYGDDCIDNDFFIKYSSSRKQKINNFRKYLDIANTIKSWMEYTQLIYIQDKKIMINPNKVYEIENILSQKQPFIDRFDDYEYFQRKFGVDPMHYKDTRNLDKSIIVTKQMLDEVKVKRYFAEEALKNPITKINLELINNISSLSGLPTNKVETILLTNFPKGNINPYLTEYYSLAFQGTSKAKEFELATAKIFKEILGFEAEHIGSIGLTADVNVVSKCENYQGIIDNKAYSNYSISNDHHNRMVHNYISSYKKDKIPLKFFLYIAGGFGKNIDNQIKKIHAETNVCGSCISVSNFITLLEHYDELGYSHKTLLKIFTKNRELHLEDF